MGRCCSLLCCLLVKRTVLIDGKPRDIREIFHDPVLSPLLSDEGALAQPTC